MPAARRLGASFARTGRASFARWRSVLQSAVTDGTVMSAWVVSRRISQSFDARSMRFSAPAGTMSAVHAVMIAALRSRRFTSHLNATFPSRTSAAAGMSACSMYVAKSW